MKAKQAGTQALRQRRVAKLWKKGQELLERGENEKVLEVARNLERERYSGCFDLAAQAYAALGKLTDAIATLERGVLEAPNAWLNWQLLGNYRSDAEDFEGAATAYQRALSCDKVWEDSVRLNQAILAERRGNIPEAMEMLQHIRDPDLALERADVMARILLHAGRTAEALEECRRVSYPDEPTPAQRACIARLCVVHAKALISLGERPELVRELIADTIGNLSQAPELLLLLRELRAEVTSEESRVFKVVVSYALDATARDEAGAVGFVRLGHVAAETPEKAIELLREIEGNSFLTLDEAPEVELLDEQPGELNGILWVGERHFYVARE